MVAYLLREEREADGFSLGLLALLLQKTLVGLQWNHFGEDDKRLRIKKTTVNR